MHIAISLICFIAVQELDYSEDDASPQPMDVIENALEMDSDDINTTVPRNSSQATRGKINFITPRLVSALDNAKVSDGMAIHILTAAAEALGHNIADLIINRSTIHRVRQQNRRKESEKIQTDFASTVS